MKYKSFIKTIKKIFISIKKYKPFLSIFYNNLNNIFPLKQNKFVKYIYLNLYFIS